MVYLRSNLLFVFSFNFFYKPETKLLYKFFFVHVFLMVESIFFHGFSLKKTSESRTLVIQKVCHFKMLVIASPNEFFSSVILFDDLFEFLVSFSIFHFCRSVVLGLNNFDMKLQSFRLNFGLSLRM